MGETRQRCAICKGGFRVSATPGMTGKLVHRYLDWGAQPHNVVPEDGEPTSPRWLQADD